MRNKSIQGLSESPPSEAWCRKPNHVTDTETAHTEVLKHALLRG